MTIAIVVLVAFVAGVVVGTLFGRKLGAAALAKAQAELNLLKSL